MTGYYSEVARGINVTSGAKIEDNRLYYFESYEAIFHWMMLSQLCSGAFGVLMMVAWFAWNIWLGSPKKNDTNSNDFEPSNIT